MATPKLKSLITPASTPAKAKVETPKFKLLGETTTDVRVLRTTTPRGTIWRLPNGYWRACDFDGKQCTFKIQTEAFRFSQQGKRSTPKTVVLLTESCVRSSKQYIRTIDDPIRKKYAREYLKNCLNEGKEPVVPAIMAPSTARLIRMHLRTLLKPIL